MVSEKEQLLKKLKNVGNPLFLVKMMNQGNKFMASHQIEPKAEETDRMFLDISGVYYELQKKQAVPVETIDAKYIVIKMSQQAVDALAELTQSDSKNLNKLLKDLKKVENIKKYQEIFAILDDSFAINVSVSQLIKVAF